MANIEKDVVYDNFNKIRKSKNLTYQAVSKQSGVPMPTLFGLKKHSPSNETLKAIAAGLGVSTDELMGLEPIRTKGPQIIEIPVWKMADYKSETHSTRYLADTVGLNTFGLILNPMDSGYPKGAIFYFNPDMEPTGSDIVLLKSEEHYLVKKMYKEANNIRFLHLKYDEIEAFKHYEILATCVLIVIDPFFSKFD